MAGLVQLGTLTLLLDPAQQTAGPSSESAWAPLESSLITEGHWAEESQAAAELVAQLLKDAQLGMICERQLHSDRVVLRVAVRANDHGAWSVSNSHRVKRLRALLHLLNRGWEEGGGEPLLQTPVCIVLGGS